MTKIGIFGGTFDPIHIGHLIICMWAKEALSLDLILIIPTANPPHKQTEPSASINDRCEMVRQAIKDISFFKFSDIEANSSEVTFTVNTLRYIRSAYADQNPELYLIIGDDSFKDLHLWKEPDEIFRISRIVVANRVGIKKTENTLSDRVTFLDTPVIAVSSTIIRKRILANKTIRFLIPAAVENYINNAGLYRE